MSSPSPLEPRLARRRVVKVDKLFANMSPRRGFLTQDDPAALDSPASAAAADLGATGVVAPSSRSSSSSTSITSPLRARLSSPVVASKIQALTGRVAAPRVAHNHVLEDANDRVVVTAVPVVLPDGVLQRLGPERHPDITVHTLPHAAPRLDIHRSNRAS